MTSTRCSPKRRVIMCTLPLYTMEKGDFLYSEVEAPNGINLTMFRDSKNQKKKKYKNNNNKKKNNNGPQLAKMKKSINDMSLPYN